MIGFQLKRLLLTGFKSLWLHRLRSILTMLGIIFGVCSVIAMLAIGEGASYEAQEQIKQLGSTNIILKAVKPTEEQSSAGSTRGGATRPMAVEYGLTYLDAERITATVPGIQVTVPSRKIRMEVRNLTRRTESYLIGTVPWFPRIMNRKIQTGRFLTSEDMYLSRNVCVLEPEVGKVLFPMDLPVGKNIKIGSDYYRVVGVMAPKNLKKENSGQGFTEIYVPLTTVRSRFGDVTVNRSSGSMDMEKVELHEICVRVDNADRVIETAAVLKGLLARFHKKKDYEVVVPLELLQRAQQIKRTYNIVLGSIAAISLLVGGIGIMNIMLATVTERTREIGIRRALGAKRRHITLQFLTETVLLAGTGGVIGVIGGIIIPVMVEYLVNMKTIVTLWSVVAAFSISVLTGILFGLYPAQRAANMDPIEALRHE